MGHCKDEWTFRFPYTEGREGPLEIRPKSFTFDASYGEYDYCKAKFSQEVGDMLRQHTESPYGRLAEKKFVQLCYEGDPRYALLFRPQHVTYGSNYTHIEFRDVLETMDEDVVDEAWDVVTVRDAYEAVWEAGKNDVIKGLRFTNLDAADGQFAAAEAVDAEAYIDGYLYDESSQTSDLLDVTTALDFQQVSPARALEEANEKFGLQSWVDLDGYLWVGIPEASERLHVAAPDDDRVWRWTDPSLRSPRDPIKAVIVKGDWIDDPRHLNRERFAQQLFDVDEKTGEVQVHGLAWRPNVSLGETFIIEDTDVKSDSIEEVATAALRNELKYNYSGQISINPQEGGHYTDPSDVRLGDYLHVVPDDDHFASTSRTTGSITDETPVVHDEDSDCRPEVSNMVFLITGVRHRINNNGSWDLSLDVNFYPFPDVYPVEATTRYFDPNSEEYLNDDGLWHAAFESGVGESLPEHLF